MHLSDFQLNTRLDQLRYEAIMIAKNLGHFPVVVASVHQLYYMRGDSKQSSLPNVQDKDRDVLLSKLGEVLKQFDADSDVYMEIGTYKSFNETQSFNNFTITYFAMPKDAKWHEAMKDHPITKTIDEVLELTMCNFKDESMCDTDVCANTAISIVDVNPIVARAGTIKNFDARSKQASGILLERYRTLYNVAAEHKMDITGYETSDAFRHRLDSVNLEVRAKAIVEIARASEFLGRRVEDYIERRFEAYEEAFGVVESVLSEKA